MDIKLGPFIRELRKMKKLTLKELANLTGLSHSQLSKIERGEHQPTWESVSKIAEALSYDQAELLDLAGYSINNENKNTNKIYLELRYKTLVKYDRTCQICGAKAPKCNIEISFVNPNKSFDKLELDNMITLCSQCNRTRDELIKKEGIEKDYLLNQLEK